MADPMAPVAPATANNLALKPGDAIPQDATGAPNQSNAPAYKPGDPIPQEATSVGMGDTEDRPGFLSTLGSDVVNAGKGIYNTAKDAALYHPSDQDQQLINEKHEEHKHQVYQQVQEDLHAGRYAKAFSNLTNLFDPHYDDPNDPIGKIVTAQWESSKLAKERMMEAAKNKDYAAVVQHAAGIMPVASQVDSAMENYRKDPSRENLAHIVSAAIPAFVPSLMKGAKYVYEGGADALNSIREAEANAPPKPNLVRPSTTNISGEDVPVSTPQKADQSWASKQISKVATKEGAQKFIDTEVQPAAIKAAGSTFRNAAEKSISDYRELSGEGGDIPQMDTIHSMAKAMEQEAKKTYARLDEAGSEDIADATKRIKEAAAAAKSKGVNYTPPPLPKSFTELQEGIREAETTLKSRTASIVDKGLAKESLKDYNDQMGNFLAKHGDAVNYGELDAADALWQKSARFKFIANKIRSATRGTENTASELKQVSNSINKDSLASLPATFDNKFGEGAFNKLLGDEGVHNFNDVINTLQNPFEKSPTEGLISTTAKSAASTSNVFIDAAKLIGKPISWVADKMLFDPEFGQAMLKKVKTAKGIALDDSGLPRPKQ